MLNAISALAPVASQLTQGIQGLGGTGMGAASAVPQGFQAPGADFGSVLANVSQGFVDNLKQGEAAAINGVQGKAAVQDVVQAVMSAEQSLNLAMAMRDKVVSAYQQFAQMAI